MNFISITDEDIKKMLSVIGVSSVSDLFSDIPEDLQEKCKLKIVPENGFSELELKNRFLKLQEKNENCSEYISFLGGGVYDHFIPEVLNSIVSRSEFLTPYTPYQAEVSQGILQAIFEYQSLICNLTGMEVSNASMYDGATALAEAIFMASRINRKTKVLISDGFSPEYLEVVKTYLANSDLELVHIGLENGITDINKLKELINQENISSVSFPYPNFFGQIEDIVEIKKLILQKTPDTLLIISVYPVILGTLKSPGELGANIVVGNGQSLGNTMSFGGPTFGFFASEMKYVRKMPGRIVGETQDSDGNTGYVLTLQTREQHIRRERATSNICTNEALNTLAGAIYLSLVGKIGLKELGELLIKNTHYFIDELEQINGCRIKYDKKRIFNEFVLNTPVKASKIVEEFLNAGIFAGIDLGKFNKNSEYDQRHDLLVAVTEKRTKQDFDKYVQELKTILGKN